MGEDEWIDERAGAKDRGEAGAGEGRRTEGEIGSTVVEVDESLTWSIELKDGLWKDLEVV